MSQIDKEKMELAKKRDSLQNTMNESRSMRAQIKLTVRGNYRDFVQKIGELSFLLGAAIIPLLLTRSNETASHINYLLIGVGIYLLNGIVALWWTKTHIETDGNDARLVSLDEQLSIYPLTNALNKLIHDPASKEYRSEYEQAKVATVSVPIPTESNKPSFTADLVLTAFIIASLLVIRSAWPYEVSIYWGSFAAILLITTASILASYIRALQSTSTVAIKQATIDIIKSEFHKWRDRNPN